MSPDDFAPDLRDCGGDVAAYALGALEPAEAEAFREHLEACAVCRDELAAFRQVVDTLPSAAPEYPLPPGTRRRIMRSVRAEPRTVPGRRSAAFFGGRLVPRPVLAGALAAVAALAGVGIAELGSGGSSVRVIRATVAGVPGTARLRIAGGRAELIVNRFPPPPAGHIYEVWAKRGLQAPSPTSALFSVTAAGSADVGVPGSLRGVNTIMVTQEPAGGSRVPTHPPVIIARLNSD